MPRYLPGIQRISGAARRSPRRNSRRGPSSSDGRTPVNYQSDYLDPQGRVFRINLRKILF